MGVGVYMRVYSLTHTHTYREYTHTHTHTHTHIYIYIATNIHKGLFEIRIKAKEQKNDMLANRFQSSLKKDE